MLRVALAHAWAEPAASDPSLAGWIAAGCLLIAAAVAFARSLRERRRNRALLARLDQMEARLDAGPAGAVAIPFPHLSSGEDGDLVATPSGDVLAGRTSEVHRIVDGPVPVRRSLAEQAIVAVHDRLESGVSPAQLAAALHVSLRTLERGLATYLACTPRQLILAMRMREARRLLAAGDHLVKDVAYRLGFADAYHFSRSFKSFYHVAPSSARPEPGGG